MVALSTRFIGVFPAAEWICVNSYSWTPLIGDVLSDRFSVFAKEEPFEFADE